MFHCADKVRQPVGSPVFGFERCREQQRTGKQRQVSELSPGLMTISLFSMSVSPLLPCQ